MRSDKRLVNFSYGELLDRLTILSIKEILNEKDREAVSGEMETIFKDLNLLASEIKIRHDARFIRLIIALAQINLHIWKTKDIMQKDKKQFNRSMKLAHQLNGIRNRIKNEFAAKKTNIGTDRLKGWDLSVLRKAPTGMTPQKSAKRSCNYLLTDLIDALTIDQIKEVLLPAVRKNAVTEDILKLTCDVDLILTQKKLKLSARQIRLIVFLAQANLFIWFNKDEMAQHKKKYFALLSFAQDLNGLRNYAKNLLMRELTEENASQKRVTFLEEDKSKWYAAIMRSMRSPGPYDSDEKTLKAEDFARLFGTTVQDLPKDSLDIILKNDFRYRTLDKETRDKIIGKIITRIDSGSMWVSGEDKKDVWENGWSENLKQFEKTADISVLTPKFIQSHPVLRLNRDYISPLSPQFEFDFVDVFRRWAFKKFLKGSKALYEFGCGSCQHIPLYVELFPGIPIHGLDWANASLEIMKKLAREKRWDIQGHIFNLFKPDKTLELKEGSGVLTIGTMEQMGQNYGPFLEFLLERKPRAVMHIETIRELYDEAHLTDYLALRYDAKRNYLDGFLTKLRELENKEKIQIIKAHRMFFGSMYHDSYSFIVWRPL